MIILKKIVGVFALVALLDGNIVAMNNQNQQNQQQNKVTMGDGAIIGVYSFAAFLAVVAANMASGICYGVPKCSNTWYEYVVGCRSNCPEFASKEWFGTVFMGLMFTLFLVKMGTSAKDRVVKIAKNTVDGLKDLAEKSPEEVFRDIKESCNLQ